MQSDNKLTTTLEVNGDLLIKGMNISKELNQLLDFKRDMEKYIILQELKPYLSGLILGEISKLI